MRLLQYSRNLMTYNNAQQIQPFLLRLDMRLLRKRKLTQSQQIMAYGIRQHPPCHCNEIRAETGGTGSDAPVHPLQLIVIHIKQQAAVVVVYGSHL